jgi:hypothetical protein
MTYFEVTPANYRTSRYFVLIGALVQNYTCSGIILGWPALVRTIYVSGWGELDAPFVGSIFVIASSANMIANLLAGILLDLKGPRVCSVCSLLCVSLGTS